MSNVHLLNALRKHYRARNDAALARAMGFDQAILTRLNKRPTAPLSPSFILRCYDQAGFSIEKTRELHARE